MPDRRGLYAGILSIFGWGTAGMLIKLLPALSPLMISGIRSIIAVGFLLAFILSQSHLRPYLTRLHKATTLEFALYTAIFYYLAVVAYKYALVAEAALVLSTSPLIVLLWGALRGHSIPMKDKIGAISALSGVILIFLPRLRWQAAQSEAQLTGLLAALAGSAVIAFYVLRVRHLETTQRRPEIWGINLLGFLILSLPLLLVPFDADYYIQWQQVNTGQSRWVAIWLGLISTAVPGVGYAYASIKLKPILTTSLRFCTPVVATVLAALFLGEMPGVNVYLGGVLVLFGLVWMTVRRR